MAGHSHWAGIKHKKGAADAKRGKIFSKLAKAIISAARGGGGDPDMNLKLKYAIEKARAANMPKDNIERAIKRGTGELEGTKLEALTYEGYGPGGVALMLDVLTDNRNRTASEVRKIFERRGGSLGSSGCVDWMFDRKGLFTIEKSAIEEEDLMEIAIEAGADDVTVEDDLFEVTCEPGVFDALMEALKKRGLDPRVAEIALVPTSQVRTDSAEEARRILALMDALEDHDDVQNLYANFDIPADILRQIEEESG